MLSASAGGDKHFGKYLKQYEDELSKSLLVMQPGTRDYKKRIDELAKVAEMRSVFVENA